jgi:hypothetical protein
MTVVGKMAKLFAEVNGIQRRFNVEFSLEAFGENSVSLHHQKYGTIEMSYHEPKPFSIWDENGNIVVDFESLLACMRYLEGQALYLKQQKLNQQLADIRSELKNVEWQIEKMELGKLQ